MIEHRKHRPAILMLISTGSFDTDDRLRKECNSVREHLGDVSVVGFENRAPEGRQGEIAKGVPFVALPHVTKKRLPAGRGLAFKALETLLRLLPRIVRQRPDVLWVHDPAFWPVVWVSLALRRLGIINKVVWDLHELIPDSRLRGPARRMILGCLQNVDVLVMTNTWRYQHMQETLPFVPRHLMILENYPDASVSVEDRNDLPNELEKWLEGRDFILGQGAVGADRNFASLREAVERSGIPIVLLGRCEAGLDPRLFYCTGWVPQAEVYRYINRALFSVVLYSRNDPNAWYCSPNRLFQAIARGCPVLGGINPPIKAVLEETGAGVVLSDDGANVEELIKAISGLKGSLSIYQTRAALFRNKYVWENDFAGIAQDLKSILCER